MQAFSKSRNVDAETICDLSMQNYIEVCYVLYVLHSVWFFLFFSYHSIFR